MKRETTVEGSSVEEAVDSALEELGVQQDVVEIEVLEEPSKRLFGKGSETAKVRVKIKDEFIDEISSGSDDAEEPESKDEDSAPSDASAAGNASRGGVYEHVERTDEELDQVADAGTSATKSILDILGIEATIEEYEGEDGEIILDIVGPELGILIGRHGKTLDALQVIVSATVRRSLGWYYPLLVDVEGYRSRRKDKLEDIARNAADRAIRQGRDVRLRPMNSYERKVVHVTLRDDARVETGSEGEEPFRSVVVSVR